MSLQKVKPVYMMLGLTTCTFVLHKIYKKFKTSTTRTQQVSPLEIEDEHAISLVSAPFRQASILAKSLSLDQNDQLMLYGLYKQANEGNASNTTEPRRLNVVAFTKYSSWKKFHNMPRHFAMMKYIEVVEHFVELNQNESDGGARKVCVGSGNDAVKDMMNQDDIDYGEDSSVDLSEDSEDENEDRKHLQLGSEMNLAAKQSTLSGGHVLQREGEMNFMQAASVGDATSLKEFIDSGADVNERDESGQSALHMAADNGSIECVQKLLAAGSDPNAADNDGISVLQAAVIGGSIDVAKILLSSGADPDHHDLDGDTPRSCAEDDDNEDMKVLLRTSKSVDIVNKSFDSFISQASC
mmetsp:Transcript_6191/g.9386  ORF Transcript_6191/g.9386 Transcript_6191/m.9386 type:complete len:354 (-) Transcript_6191:68-1129(-)